jgi:hypothetical protein
MTTHPLWRPFQLIDPVEVDSRLLMPRSSFFTTRVTPAWQAANASRSQADPDSCRSIRGRRRCGHHRHRAQQGRCAAR